MGDFDSDAEAFMDLVRHRAAGRRLLRQSSDAVTALSNSLRHATDASESDQPAQQPAQAPVAEGGAQEEGATSNTGGSGSAQGAQNPADTPMEVDQPGE